MNRGNESTVPEFFLLGFSNLKKLQLLLFPIFFLAYIVILISNISIMTAITVTWSLHTPMYFFLFALSFSELCSTFVIIPKTVVNLLVEKKTISVIGCATQMFGGFGFGAINCFLLTVMAYDRYVAICHPLQYSAMMNRKVCIQLVTISCVTGFLISLTINSLVFSLPLCGPRTIRHFFCDVKPVLRLACGAIYLAEIVVVSLCAFVIVGTFTVIIISYIYILSAILKIHSVAGRCKTFSTCASHLTVVVTHYGCASFVYLRPKSSSSLNEDTLISVGYLLLTPCLNPMIYSLRNKEVKFALKKLVLNSLCFFKKR
ncbi:olfactory receptor 10T2-like [Alligator mississippiensis]|uniref:olfactory receptor 10T2-like n=1 Tax=Alligator mississippiensis TaxID=8496 RepID=UPI0003D09560|nr:olfactory receptor 10T2-like [Alligator mississippiensis]